VSQMGNIAVADSEKGTRGFTSVFFRTLQIE
jgi:hypothetical protein